MGPRVLIADTLAPEPFEPLRALGAELDYRPDLTADTLPAAVPGAKVLVVRSTEVRRPVVEAGRELALIVRAGSGTNTIDVAAASEHGVYVANCPGKNSVAVAELAMGLIIALDRSLVENVADLRQGQWNKGRYSKARGLKGRRLGILGFGSIGRELAVRARAFGLQISAYSRSLSDAVAEELAIARAPSPEALFDGADILSVHLPLSAATRGLVTRALLERLPAGATFINTARAEVVDQAALEERVRAGLLRVGTDVYAREPEGKAGPFEDPLGRLAGVYGTHHIGASTEQAQAEIARATVQIVRRFLEVGEVEGAVNLLAAPPVQGTLVVRHLDRVGVLAAILGTLRSAKINVETMENLIFAGRKAACARIRVAERPAAEVVAQIAGLEHVLHVELI